MAFAAVGGQNLERAGLRLSVAKRYADFDGYAKAVRQAIDRLVKRRLLLCEGTAAEQARLYTAGVAAGIAAPAAGVPASQVLPHCRARIGDDDDDDNDDHHRSGDRD